ncbi:uncharacterized protein Dana_GF27404 [Drosophila ananassae]|uniref:Uncharacterized protein n=1 Tax=Drosophila ananassae TaxID=7217 RepID=A0A0P8XWG5_DROAN|nr:uncharacterized protein LOC26514813 [Drosophila ananassae]KPU73719.1 uncharacterized protein Dana_GF27404 [Drosophila ananassae]
MSYQKILNYGKYVRYHARSLRVDANIRKTDSLEDALSLLGIRRKEDLLKFISKRGVKNSSREPSVPASRYESAKSLRTPKSRAPTESLSFIRFPVDKDLIRRLQVEKRQQRTKNTVLPKMVDDCKKRKSVFTRFYQMAFMALSVGPIGQISRILIAFFSLLVSMVSCNNNAKIVPQESRSFFHRNVAYLFPPFPDEMLVYTIDRFAKLLLGYRSKTKVANPIRALKGEETRTQDPFETRNKLVVTSNCSSKNSSESLLIGGSFCKPFKGTTKDPLNTRKEVRSIREFKGEESMTQGPLKSRNKWVVTCNCSSKKSSESPLISSSFCKSFTRIRKPTTKDISPIRKFEGEETRNYRLKSSKKWVVTCNCSSKRPAESPLIGGSFCKSFKKKTKDPLKSPNETLLVDSKILKNLKKSHRGQLGSTSSIFLKSFPTEELNFYEPFEDTSDLTLLIKPRQKRRKPKSLWSMSTKCTPSHPEPPCMDCSFCKAFKRTLAHMEDGCKRASYKASSLMEDIEQTSAKVIGPLYKRSENRGS